MTEAPGSPADEIATRIAAGYAVEGQALELGALVHGGTSHPDAQVRLPLIAERLSAAGVPVVLADV